MSVSMLNFWYEDLNATCFSIVGLCSKTHFGGNEFVR